VGRRLGLAALVLAAPLADLAGAHSAAFWSLAAALPFAAACALASFGAHLDARSDRARSLQALLWVPALALLLAGAAARGPALATASVPRLGVTAVAGCLSVLALKGLVWGAVWVYRGSGRASSIRVSSGSEGRGLRAPVAAKPARS
jgi:hypothetical protein